jgi:hypothetical protein
MLLKQHIPRKKRRYKGAENGRPCVDLIIADVPKDLPVPTISNPSTSIPVWNELPTNFLESLFDFASEYLQDNGALILIHAAEIPLLKSEIRSYF